MRAAMSESPRPAKRVRASRAGKPHVYVCQYEGCGKSYTRAEHRARHELNHNPRQIHQCTVPGCTQTFVRADLCARHTARHAQEENDAKQNDGANAQDGHRSDLDNGTSTQSRPNTAHLLPSATPVNPQSAASEPTGGFVTVTASPTTTSLLAQTTSRLDAARGSQEYTYIIQSSESAHGLIGSNLQDDNWLESSTVIASELQPPATDNFASWLFGTPDSQEFCFDASKLPFIDFGSGWSPVTTFETPTSWMDSGAFNLRGQYEPEEGSLSRIPSHSRISEAQRSRIVELFSNFVRKSRSATSYSIQPDHPLFPGHNQDYPNLDTTFLQTCIAEAWNFISAQIPVIHQATFSCDSSPAALLAAMAASGAAEIVRSRPKGQAWAHRQFADILMTGLRWEIFTDADAQPPVQLWVAQALLLVELYEKMHSTRNLHERAHIGHSYTLNLLRRGSPLVGRSGSETPREAESPRANPAPAEQSYGHGTSHMTHWWHRWARNESMRRVVFAAFQMDIFHAVMFGHNADLAPYEIRIPLPCDDSLWLAQSAEEVQRLDETLALHGVKPINFLEALKLCLHGHEVHTHFQARTVLFSGLLSVGWHISRREKNLQFLENLATGHEQNRWRSILHEAFGHWKRSFEIALGRATRRKTTKTGIDDPALLYYFANIIMNVDIVECQILAQSKILLGRRVSARDHAAALPRMRGWASTSMGRFAVLNAFKLLHAHLLPPMGLQAAPDYSFRNDNVMYRPWVFFLATLTIWAYEYACAPHPILPAKTQSSPANNARALQNYMSACAQLESSEKLMVLRSREGCSALLDVTAEQLTCAESELCQESADRLRHCQRMLLGQV